MTPHQQTRTRNEQQQVRLKQFTIAAATLIILATTGAFIGVLLPLDTWLGDTDGVDWE